MECALVPAFAVDRRDSDDNMASCSSRALDDAVTENPNPPTDPIGRGSPCNNDIVELKASHNDAQPVPQLPPKVIPNIPLGSTESIGLLFTYV
jgi:hypothetical protein